MEIPELIIALKLKMKQKAEDIKEEERKLSMSKHDFDVHFTEIESIKDIRYEE